MSNENIREDENIKTENEEQKVVEDIFILKRPNDNNWFVLDFSPEYKIYKFKCVGGHLINGRPVIFENYYKWGYGASNKIRKPVNNQNLYMNKLNYSKKFSNTRSNDLLIDFLDENIEPSVLFKNRNHTIINSILAKDIRHINTLFKQPAKSESKDNHIELENKFCPNCGKNSIIKKILPNGSYILICRICNLELGEFKKNVKKGVI